MTSVFAELVVVAVAVVEMVGSKGMAWSCIVVSGALFRGCIEVVPGHRWCIAAAGTADAGAGVDETVADVADVVGIAGGVREEEDVVVAR
jgi:hypothetical protein